MMTYRAKLAVVVGVTVAIVLVCATTFAFASIGPNKTVKVALKKGNKMTFEGVVNGTIFTVTCETFKVTGKTRSKPAYTFNLSAPPTLSGCTDSWGGTDTIKTNATNGKWTLSVNKAATEVTLTIPKAGATFTSSMLNGCAITATPTAADPVTGSYNGSNIVRVGGAEIPWRGRGCSPDVEASATVVLSPAPGKPPWG